MPQLIRHLLDNLRTYRHEQGIQDAECAPASDRTMEHRYTTKHAARLLAPHPHRAAASVACTCGSATLELRHCVHNGVCYAR